MANRTFDIPDGYVPVVMLFPESRIQDVIDTYAEAGGYNPQIHGDTPEAKNTVAVNALAAQSEQLVSSRAARIAAANQSAGNKITAKL